MVENNRHPKNEDPPQEAEKEEMHQLMRETVRQIAVSWRLKRSSKSRFPATR